MQEDTRVHKGGISHGGRDRRSKLLWLAVFCLLCGLRAIQFILNKKKKKKKQLFLISKFDMKNRKKFGGRHQMLILFDCCWVVNTVTVQAQ